MSKQQWTITHIQDGVYRVRSTYYGDEVTLTAMDLRDLSDWLLLHMRELEQWCVPIVTEMRHD